MPIPSLCSYLPGFWWFVLLLLLIISKMYLLQVLNQNNAIIHPSSNFSMSEIFYMMKYFVHNSKFSEALFISAEEYMPWKCP